MKYTPRPIDIDNIKISSELESLSELLARNTHELWALERLRQGWRHGPTRDDKSKEHPCLVPYDELPENEKIFDRNSAIGTIKLILALGHSISINKINLSSLLSSTYNNYAFGGLKNENLKNYVLNSDLSAINYFWSSRAFDKWAFNPETYGDIASRALILGAPLLAHEIVSKGLSLWPNNQYLEEIVIKALMRLDNVDKAIDYAQRIIDNNLENCDFLNILGSLYKKKWVYGDSITDLESSIKYYKKSFEVECTLWSSINYFLLVSIYEKAAEKTIKEIPAEYLRTKEIVVQNIEQQFKDTIEVDGTREELFWAYATYAEFYLINKNLEQSFIFYQKASSYIYVKEIDFLIAIRKNFSLILEKLFDQLLEKDKKNIINRFDNAINYHKVLIFSGHMVDLPDAKVERFPLEKINQVYNAIYKFLKERGPFLGISSASSGSDILFLEAMQALNYPVYLVLPCHIDDFIKFSVLPYGEQWVDRFYKVYQYAGPHVFMVDYQGASIPDYYYSWANKLMYGLAVVRAKELNTSIEHLAVWNNKVEGKEGGTLSVLSEWSTLQERTRIHINNNPIANNKVFYVDLYEIISKNRATERQEIKELSISILDDAKSKLPQMAISKNIKAIFYADAVGYSRFSEDELIIFEKHIKEMINKLSQQKEYDRIYFNSWGDAVFLIFDDVNRCGNFAIMLQQLLKDFDYKACGLSKMIELRIALHVGPLTAYKNDESNAQSFLGTHVCRAARLEPITPPGDIYSTFEFACLTVLSSSEEQNFKISYVGKMNMPKKYGEYHTYRVSSI